MEQAMIPIRVSRLSDWKIYGSQWGHLRSTLDRCGVFFCRAGEVELEIDNTPYIIKPVGKHYFMNCRWYTIPTGRCFLYNGHGKYFKQCVGMSPKEYHERSFYPREEVVFDNQ